MVLVAVLPRRRYHGRALTGPELVGEALRRPVVGVGLVARKQLKHLAPVQRELRPAPPPPIISMIIIMMTTMMSVVAAC